MMVPVSDEVVAFLDKRGYEPVNVAITNEDDFAIIGSVRYMTAATGFTGYARLIVRKKVIETAVALQPGWIVTNCGKMWFHCKDEPQQRPDGRYSITGMMIDQTMLRWTPPIVTGPTKYEIK